MIINFTDLYKFTFRLELKLHVVQIVDKMKILGVTITNALNWIENISILVQKVNNRMQLARAVGGFGWEAASPKRTLKILREHRRHLPK